MSSERRAADPTDPTKWVAPSGATSSALKPEYRLVPFATIRRIGQRLTDGARKHGEGNWEKALDDRTFMMDRANHLIEHAYRAIEKLQKGIFTDDDDDDLGGIGANLAFLIGYQEHQRNKTGYIYNPPESGYTACADFPTCGCAHIGRPEGGRHCNPIVILSKTALLNNHPFCKNCGHQHFYESGDDHNRPWGKCRIEGCNCVCPSYST